MPKSSKFSVQSVKKLIGGDRIIEVIEVKSQGSRQMSLDEFVKYYRYSNLLKAFFDCRVYKGLKRRLIHNHIYDGERVRR